MTVIIKSRVGWAVYSIPLIPALLGLGQRHLRVRGRPGLQSKFQNSQGYTDTFCLKKTKTKPKLQSGSNIKISRDVWVDHELTNSNSNSQIQTNFCHCIYNGEDIIYGTLYINVYQAISKARNKINITLRGWPCAWPSEQGIPLACVISQRDCHNCIRSNQSHD